MKKLACPIFPQGCAPRCPRFFLRLDGELRYYLSPADLSDISVIPSVIEKSLERFGRIDILVNNAGVISKSSGVPHLPAGMRAKMSALLSPS